ncbi:DEKNAAC103809 [Brettanomyces naardenensis]|uniref:DEKNAAC103809 n=1 Tax=Brettanomyces naardenensis TaxID=13370 RepID=A0A448YPC0_BRENA|nr:DEKNAAC103809 [Brettanomyces naardenensis]
MFTKCQQFFRRKHNGALSTLILGYGSLGAIYGDLATSPLYVLSSLFKSSPHDEDLMGGLSCIFWCFTFIVIIKYALVVLTYGPNHNEGGQIAIYSKIASKMRFNQNKVMVGNQEDSYGTDNFPTEDDLLALTRTTTVDTTASVFSKHFARSVVSVISLTCALLGCSLVFSDGLLTPTTSVLSAIDGISTAVPSFHSVMPVSVAVLFIMFVAQRLGSGKLSIMFSPIILIWLVCLFINGVYWIAKNPSVMKALNPAYAFKLLARQKNIDVFAPVMLSVTGTEAMFADIAHFGALPIQLTLIFFVYPCLMVCYLGQGAYLRINPQGFSSNLFFSAIPFGGVGSGYYWFIFVLATLATIIASQALILGCFAILKQLIHLDFFPRLTLVHTSKSHKGRVYIPVANFVLMVAVILTTVGFRTSNNVTAAYGLGISIDFMMTTTLISITLRYVYHFHWLVSTACFIIFGSFEACLIISGVRKFIHGAWFPLMICLICFSFINFWRLCRGLAIQEDSRHRKSVAELFGDRARTIARKRSLVLDLKDRARIGNSEEDRESAASATSAASTASSESADTSDDFALFNNDGELISVPKIPKVFFIYCSSYSTVGNSQSLPRLMQTIVSSFFLMPAVCIFIETRISTLPVIPEDHPFTTVVPIDNRDYSLHLYRCLIRSGFMKQTIIDETVLKDILGQIRDYEDDDQVMELPTLHVFERDLTVSKSAPDGEVEEETVSVEKSRERTRVTQYMARLWMGAVYSVRKVLIDWIFSPLSNGSMEYLLDKDFNEDRVYVGEKVFI